MQKTELEGEKGEDRGRGNGGNVARTYKMLSIAVYNCFCRKEEHVQVKSTGRVDRTLTQMTAETEIMKLNLSWYIFKLIRENFQMHPL